MSLLLLSTMVVLLMVLLAPLPLQDLAEEVGVDPMEEANIARLQTIVGATLDAAEESMQAKQQDTKELKASEKEGKEGKVID